MVIPTESEIEVATHAKRPTPILPTEAMVQEHEENNHMPYRCWCSACVRGRARATPHKKVEKKDKADEQVPTMSVDYGFLSKRDREKSKGAASSSKDGRSLHVLIAKDRRSKAIWSIPVSKKGVEHPYPGNKLLEVLETTGHKRVIAKSDQEHSIEALISAVKNGWSGELMAEGAPKGQSQANGEVERAVQEV